MLVDYVEISIIHEQSMMDFLDIFLTKKNIVGN